MKNFIHPLEIESRNLPLFNKAVKALSGAAADIAAENISLASSNRRLFPVTNETFPRVYGIYRNALDSLGFNTEFPLFISNEYKIEASTAGGSDHYIIIISSGSVDRLSDDELSALIGRELGHIGCGHMQYKELFKAVKKLSDMVGIIGKAVVTGMLSALISWNKASEFTADRAGAIAAGSVQAVIDLIAVQSGAGKKSKYVDFDPYCKASVEDLPQEIGFINGMILIQMLEDINCQYGISRINELKYWGESSECKAGYSQLYYRYAVFKAGRNVSRQQMSENNEENSLCLMHKAADMGDPGAAFNLGKRYLTGQGDIEKNEIVGLRYLKRSALGGNGKAIYVIGLCFRDGSYGIKKNIASAWHMIGYASGMIGASAEEALNGLGYKCSRILLSDLESIAGKRKVTEKDEEMFRSRLWIPGAESIYRVESISGCFAAICESGIFCMDNTDIPVFIPWDRLMGSDMSAQYFEGADHLYSGRIRIYLMEKDIDSMSKTIVKIKLKISGRN